MLLLKGINGNKNRSLNFRKLLSDIPVIYLIVWDLRGHVGITTERSMEPVGSNRKMKVYLAGPIFQCEDSECIHWRQEVKKRLNGFQIIDPMERDYRSVTDENYKKIVEEDKALIDSCDIILVNHLKPSVGTSMEILYAWEQNKKILLISNGHELSPWLLYHSHKILPFLEDAITYLTV